MKLIGREQRITSGRLAVMQGVHKSAVSSRIKKLLEKDLIRVVETANRREKLLELTEKGIHIQKQSDKVLTEYVEKLFGQYIEDEQIEQFLTIFRKLKDIIKTDGV